MNTLALTRRYGVPAMLAAAIHAVLFFAFVPGLPEIIITPPSDLPRLPPFPPRIYEVPVTPPEPAVTDQTVKPLTGGAPRPISEDFSRRDLGEFVISSDQTTPMRPDVPITVVPNLPNGPGGPGAVEWGNTPGNFVGIDGLDRVPRAIAQPSPDYPFALRQAGIEGEVVIEFDVDTTGRVVTARVVKGGERELEQAAVRAVMKWRFEPGRRDGRIVPFRMAVPIGFRVNQE